MPEYEKTAKLIKTKSQNSYRIHVYIISPSERILALALEDKTSQTLHERSSKTKTKTSCLKVGIKN